jgi:hypothetical protein
VGRRFLLWRRTMPLLRYFTYVGGALIALLFVASYLFPEAETVAHQDVTKPNIRIATDRVVPPRVDFDTGAQAAIVPTLPPGVMLLQAPTLQASALQARAQLTAPPSSVAAVPVKPETKKTVVARRHDRQRIAAYPHFAAYPYQYTYQPFRWTW